MQHKGLNFFTLYAIKIICIEVLIWNLSYPLRDFSSSRLDLKSWPEVQEYLNHCKGIIFSIGSIEQHDPTGAIGTDALTSESISHEVARQTGVLVSSTQNFGMAQHHLGFPGTIAE